MYKLRELHKLATAQLRKAEASPGTGEAAAKRQRTEVKQEDGGNRPPQEEPQATQPSRRDAPRCCKFRPPCWKRNSLVENLGRRVNRPGADYNGKIEMKTDRLNSKYKPQHCAGWIQQQILSTDKHPHSHQDLAKLYDAFKPNQGAWLPLNLATLALQWFHVYYRNHVW